MPTCVLCTIGYRTILYIQAKLLFPKLTERRDKDCWWPGLEDNIFAEDTLILFWFQTKIKQEKNHLQDIVMTVFIYISRLMKGVSKIWWQTLGPPSWRHGWCAVQETLSNSTTTWSRQWYWLLRIKGLGFCMASFPMHGKYELPDPAFFWFQIWHIPHCEEEMGIYLSRAKKY